MNATKMTILELNTHVAVIPGDLTSQLQPLDLSTNTPFKAFISEEWTKWMEVQNHALTPAG
jgi:hypothetical protein